MFTAPDQNARKHQRDPNRGGNQIDVVSNAIRFSPAQGRQNSESLTNVRQSHNHETGNPNKLQR